VSPLRGRPHGSWSKRCFDIVVAAVLLLALAPVMLLCAVAVLLGDGLPILFRQKRVGQHGRPFWIVKFRTMRPALGAEVTAAGDPRVTRVGRVLRRFKLDELPQLSNVLVGEMSLVGPRPEMSAYVVLHQRAYGRIWDLRPGVTDWASLAFWDEEDILLAHGEEPRFYEEFLLPRKLALARLYRRRTSVRLDARLIAATAFLGAGLDSLGIALAGRQLVERARADLPRPRPKLITDHRWFRSSDG